MYFSICIPTYNRKYILSRALKSLENQTFKDFEVLVVDDGSTDDTGAFMDKYIESTKMNVRYFYKNNGGKHTALNLGIRNAQGMFFVILDSDDIFSDDCLKFFYNKSKMINENDDICGIIARCGHMDTGKMIGKPFPKDGFITSYLDIHFGSGLSLFHTGYSDCLEAMKTEIMKKYSWPETIKTKFIPEDYVTDQIGMEYKLLGFNKTVEYKEYFTDGITKNQEEYKKKNIDGYLLKYIWNIKNLLQNSNMGLLARFRICYQYFYGVSLKNGCIRERNINIPFPYKHIKNFLPILNRVKDIFRKIN